MFALGASVLFVAGCGGDDTYGLLESEPCLAQLGVTTGQPDRIAQRGSRGATSLEIDGKTVMIMFAADETEARRAADRYHAASRAATTRRVSNVLMAWIDPPNNEETKAVADCLEPARTSAREARRIAKMRAAPKEAIAYVDRDRVYTIHDDGSGRAPVMLGSDPAWSPDARRIAVGTEDGTTYVYGAPRGNHLNDLSPLICDKPAWSPDGRSIVCVGPGDGEYHDPPKFWLISLATTAEESLPVPVDQTSSNSASWSPDGTRLAVDYARGIGVLTLKTRRLRKIAVGTSPDWSPNGDLIAYSTGNAIVTSRPDGSKRQTIVRSDNFVDDPIMVTRREAHCLCRPFRPHDIARTTHRRRRRQARPQTHRQRLEPRLGAPTRDGLKNDAPRSKMYPTAAGANGSREYRIGYGPRALDARDPGNAGRTPQGSRRASRTVPLRNGLGWSGIIEAGGRVR